MLKSQIEKSAAFLREHKMARFEDLAPVAYPGSAETEAAVAIKRAFRQIKQVLMDDPNIAIISVKEGRRTVGCKLIDGGATEEDVDVLFRQLGRSTKMIKAWSYNLRLPPELLQLAQTSKG